MRVVAFVLVTVFSSLAVAQTTQIQFERPALAAGAQLRIGTPDGRILEQLYNANENITLDMQRFARESLADGRYPWEIRYSPRWNHQQHQ